MRMELHLMKHSLESTLYRLGINYHHIAVSEENGRCKLSVRCDYKESEFIAKMFLEMTNFCCNSTSSYKKKPCQDVKTYFKTDDITSSIELIKTYF